jgi:hypothetical protein
MSLLPQLTNLGKLEIIEVYVYYDQPCLFSCKNLTGHIFLAVWIDETEVEDIWLYVPISKQRFQSIRSGEIDLRDAFLKSEDSLVYKVIIPQENLPSLVETIQSDRLNEDWLPVAGEYLECEPEELNVLAK